ncbi:MAG: 3-ketoacyl-ACP reductase [Balneolaceae bacterium]
MNPAALVTGGSRGIGLAIAQKLTKIGYDVAINGVREQAEVFDVLQDLKSAGTNIIYCQGDIGSEKGRNNIVEKVKSEFGRLNVLVNNAGVAPHQRQDPLKTTIESFERVMQINLQGTFFLTQSIANWLIDQKKQNNDYSAMVINIGSISASVASPMRAEYCISKAGLAMHCKIWAVRLAEFNIQVYEIRPGIIKTDMTSGVKNKYDKLIAKGLTVQRRWGLPEDVAKAVGALVRGDFPYSTGEIFMIDGGLTTKRL